MARPDQIYRLNPEREARFGLSAMVRSGNTLYVAGLISVDDDFNLVGEDDMGAQIDRIYTRLEAVLALASADLRHVVSEVSYTTNMEALAAAAGVRDERYSQARAAPPAATAVEVRKLYLPGAMLELVATAEVPPGSA
jgi:enamine deaminase RidA (YjgF/YER057c/UK114 family)